MNYRNLLVMLFLSMPFASYAAGECSKYKSFIASKIHEGTRIYKTSGLRDQQWPEKKCQIKVTTKLEDTVTLGRFNENGLLACQAVYTVLDTETGQGFNMKSTSFAITVSDSGKPLDAFYSTTPSDDIRSAMAARYQPPPFSIKLSNEGVEKIGSTKGCFVETTPAN